VCLCVHPKTLLTRYLAEYLTHCHQTYISDALWDRGECVTICVQRSSSRWNKVCWKQHFLGLLTWCTVQMNALNFGVKSLRFKVTVEWYMLEPSLYRQGHTVLDILCRVRLSRYCLQCNSCLISAFYFAVQLSSQLFCHQSAVDALMLWFGLARCPPIIDPYTGNGEKLHVSRRGWFSYVHGLHS